MPLVPTINSAITAISSGGEASTGPGSSAPMRPPRVSTIVPTKVHLLLQQLYNQAANMIVGSAKMAELAMIPLASSAL